MRNNQNSYSKIYWYNPNNQRYYIVRRIYDLLGDLILIKEWGTASRIVGRMVNVYCPSRKQAAEHLKNINYRRKRRVIQNLK